MKFYCFIHWTLVTLLSLWLCGNKTSNGEMEEDTVVTENRDFAKERMSVGRLRWRVKDMFSEI